MDMAKATLLNRRAGWERGVVFSTKGLISSWMRGWVLGGASPSHLLKALTLKLANCPGETQNRTWQVVSAMPWLENKWVTSARPWLENKWAASTRPKLRNRGATSVRLWLRMGQVALSRLRLESPWWGLDSKIRQSPWWGSVSDSSKGKLARRGSDSTLGESPW